MLELRRRRTSPAQKQTEKIGGAHTMTYCKRCGKEIPSYNETDACKSCFNRFKKKDEDGYWFVPDKSMED